MSDEATLSQHLSELRKRLTWSAIVLIVVSIVCFIFHQQILSMLMGPASGFPGMPNEKPVYTDLTEFLGIAMKVSLMVGFFISMPFVIWHIIMFVSPGLNKSEKKYLYIFLPISMIVFAAGASFGYYILFPPAVQFLISFGTDIATPMIRIGNYVNLMISLLFWMGVVFEIPIALFFLARIGVVTPKFLSKNRRWAVVLAFILGALITPTLDPINQALVAIPIIVLFEFGILLSKIGSKLKKKNI